MCTLDKDTGCSGLSKVIVLRPLHRGSAFVKSSNKGRMGFCKVQGGDYKKVNKKLKFGYTINNPGGK
jgi:hypothetical protein